MPHRNRQQEHHGQSGNRGTGYYIRVESSRARVSVCQCFVFSGVMVVVVVVCGLVCGPVCV